MVNDEAGLPWWRRIIQYFLKYNVALANPMMRKIVTDMAADDKAKVQVKEKPRPLEAPSFSELIGIPADSTLFPYIDPFSLFWDRGVRPAVQAYYDVIKEPVPMTPEGAKDKLHGLVPPVLMATLTTGVADTLGQLLPMGADFASIGTVEAKLFSRLGMGVTVGAALQAPIKVGFLKNMEYYYNRAFKSQKLELPQAYDGVRYREFLTMDDWSRFETDVELVKPIEAMTPEEITEWAKRASGGIKAVEEINSSKFKETLYWLGYVDDDIALQDRAAKHAPSLMMLRQMAMRGFFDAKFMARSIFKGGFDNWAVEPMLNFLGYMAQEGTWVGYREAAQSAFVKGFIDEEELRSVLKRIHVPDFLLDPIIETQKLKRVDKERDLTTTQLLTAYTKGAITREECFMELKGLGFTEESAEILLKTKESTTKPSQRLPTLAQFSRAFREGIISEEDFKANLEKRGYENKYVGMLLEIEKAKFPIVKPKMTMSTLGRAFREGLINDSQLRKKLMELGYSDEEVDYIKVLYTTQQKTPSASLSKAEILKAVSMKLIDMHEGAERLIGLGYSLDDIELLYRMYGKKAGKIA